VQVQATFVVGGKTTIVEPELRRFAAVNCCVMNVFKAVSNVPSESRAVTAAWLAVVVLI
jgi:hypothetical protein